MNNSETKNYAEIEICKRLVNHELYVYNIRGSFTEEQIQSIQDECYRNLYRHGMSDEFAVRDAVGNVFVNNDIAIPDYYRDRFWIA